VTVLAKPTHPDAQGFVDYLRTDTAAKLFEEQGFTVLAPALVPVQ
jgi:ABC-type molybdate transport system substrate-binding protein